MDEIGLIINPRAGGLDDLLSKEDFIFNVRRYIRDTNLLVTRSLQDLVEAVRYFYQRGIEVIANLGGDGTNHRTLTQVIKQYEGDLPKFAFLGHGTMNTVRGYLGGREKNPLKVLERIQRHEDVARECRTLSVDGHHGFYFGQGFPARLIAAYNKEVHSSTVDWRRWTAVKTAMRVAASAVLDTDYTQQLLAPFPVITRIEGTEEERTCRAVFAGTLRTVGLGFNPLYLGDRDDGFHLYISDLRTTGWGALVNICRVRYGIKLPDSASYLTTKAEIESSERLFMIDGDLYPSRGRMHLELGPRVKIVVN